MRGNITRGIVVDVNDPLQSGRVKVWIPLFHGGYPQNDPTLASSYNLNEAGVSVGRLGDITNPDTISTLPWAPIMGHNWSSTSDIRTGLQNNSFGVFNIPKEGTEVYIAFEDDDVNYPIILGAVFHENDFTPSVLKTPLLEITPGTTIAANVTLDYNNIKNSYIIQSQNNYSHLRRNLPGASGCARLCGAYCRRQVQGCFRAYTAKAYFPRNAGKSVPPSVRGKMQPR